MKNKKILLIGNIKNDGSTSMHVYLKDLLNNLEDVDFISPETKIKPSLYKLFIYPFIIPRGYNIYHIIDHSYSFLAFFLPKNRTIVTCHDLIPLTQSKFYTFKQKILFRIYIMGLKRARFVFTISKNTKNDLINILNLKKDKIKLIPYGIDTTLFKKLDKNYLKKKYGLDGKKILFSTGHVFYKNIILILKSLNQLKIKYPNICFVKIGHFLPNESNFIKKNKLESYIIVKDSLTQKELNEFYNLSDILVFPSLYEGFGRPPLEAMACGLPVITSNTSSLPEVVGSAAIKINPLSVTELTAAITNLFENKKFKNLLIKKGYKNLERFSWKKHASSLNKYYSNILVSSSN